jgi:hypothetical protein
MGRTSFWEKHQEINFKHVNIKNPTSQMNEMLNRELFGVSKDIQWRNAFIVRIRMY